MSFGSKISGFFGVSAGGSPTPVTNTLQTVVNAGNTANKGFYVTNPSNTNNQCGNTDDLVNEIKLFLVLDLPSSYETDFGVENGKGQIKKTYSGGANDEFIINSDTIKYTDLLTTDKNNISLGSGQGNTIYMQPTTGSQYWLVQQPDVTIVDFGVVSSPYTPDTTNQKNFLMTGVSGGSFDIILGGNIVNYSITKFAIDPIIGVGDTLKFNPDAGYTLLGQNTIDSSTNYVNGGLISILRVDSTFIMSVFT